MKKIFKLIFVLLFCLVLAGCGDDDPKASDDPKFAIENYGIGKTIEIKEKYDVSKVNEAYNKAMEQLKGTYQIQETISGEVEGEAYTVEGTTTINTEASEVLVMLDGTDFYYNLYFKNNVIKVDDNGVVSSMDISEGSLNEVLATLVNGSANVDIPAFSAANLKNAGVDNSGAVVIEMQFNTFINEVDTTIKVLHVIYNEKIVYSQVQYNEIDNISKYVYENVTFNVPAELA